MATLFALAIALFIGVAPVKAEAACAHKTVKNCVCTSCGEAVHKNTEWISDTAKHRQVCKDCNAILVSSTAHKDLSYKVTSDGTQHVTTCKTCGYSVTEDHTVGKKECRCVYCEQIMGHDLKTVNNGTNHWQECSVCDYKTAEEAHDWDVTPGENGNHTKVCNVCKKEVVEACADVNTDKDCLCDTCDVAMATTEHKLVKVAAVAKKACTDEGAFEHYKCEYCGKLFSVVDYRELTAEEIIDKAEEHDESTTWFNDETSHWHVCKNKDCEVEKLSEANHTLEWKNNGDVHWQYCETCGYASTGEAHEFDVVYNNDGTHSKTCKTCGLVVESVNCWDSNDDCMCETCGGLIKHEIGPLSTVNKRSAKCEKDGWEKHYKCNQCGNLFNYDGKTCTLTSAEEVKIPATGHVETAVVHYAEYHVERCVKCEVEVGEHVAHDFTYVDNNNGKHTATCSGCSRTITEAHTDSDTDNDCVCDAGCGHVMNHQGEDLTYHARKEATCTTDGNKGYFTCNTCGGIFTGSKEKGFTEYTGNYVLEALGHDWEYRRDTLSGQHIVRCTRCESYETMGHSDTNGDCMCDIGECGALVHSHEHVYVAEVAPSCGVAGTKAYYYYKDCGRMFDMNANEISAPVAIAALDHVAGDEYEAIDGDMHAIKCENCGEVMETVAHTDSNGDNRCDVCTVELTLKHVAQVDPTCTDIGYKEYWISEVTGRKYADANGNEYITSVETIPANGHSYTTSNGNQHVCGVCGHAANHTASDRACFCIECNLPMGNHTIEVVDAVAPTCTKAGTAAYVKCSCGTMYDAMGNVITAPASIPATGHVMDLTLVNDNDDHYIVCTTCGYEAHEEHAMAVEDPLKGNYHQWICECGEVETAQHADTDGDNKCDDCGHDMSGSTVTVENHDSTTVTTGNPETVNTSKNWIQNWFSNLFSGNAGGSSSSNNATSKSNTTTSGTASTGSNSGSTSTGSSTTAANNGGNASTGSTATGSTGSTTESSGIINEFIQWLSQLFGAWLQGK